MGMATRCQRTESTMNRKTCSRPRTCAHSYIYPDNHRGSFLRWLSAHAPTLEHVALYRLWENELLSADTLLRTLGSHLRTLGIGLLGHPTHAQVAHLSLCTNINLRALCISHDYIAASLDLVLPLILLDTDAPALRHVTLGVNFTDVVDWTGYGEWSVLDSLVALHAPMLECLHICAFEQLGYMPQHAPVPSEMQRIVAARMPHCVQTGIFAGVSWEPTTWPLIHE
ncbi:hypothetical protein BD779DRAFT_563011 [Infundibulicybe gibba]|nr:hypothetical protein BD779DRAFT_563011 [Infundibulicybe gibba]